jgi:hemolysin III
MTETSYPSSQLAHRRADMIPHAIGLALIIVAGGVLIAKSAASLELRYVLAISVYVACALTSNLASWTYHFLPLHAQRKLLRRIDHAAIYPSIVGTFTPFFVQAGTTWTWFLLCLSWGLAGLAIWNKITNETVQSRWSTASYLGFGAIGLLALPDLQAVPLITFWCVVSGAGCYVVGTAFYVRRSMPFRYALWHTWVNLGGILMFIGIWYAYFH